LESAAPREEEAVGLISPLPLTSGSPIAINGVVRTLGIAGLVTIASGRPCGVWRTLGADGGDQGVDGAINSRRIHRKDHVIEGVSRRLHGVVSHRGSLAYV